MIHAPCYSKNMSILCVALCLREMAGKCSAYACLGPIGPEPETPEEDLEHCIASVSQPSHGSRSRAWEFLSSQKYVCERRLVTVYMGMARSTYITTNGSKRAVTNVLLYG
jgi:hypothetical protein